MCTCHPNCNEEKDGSVLKHNGTPRYTACFPTCGTRGAALWGTATVHIKAERTANLCPYFFQQHTVSEYTAKIDQVIVAYVQFAQVRVELQCVRERPEVVLANV